MDPRRPSRPLLWLSAAIVAGSAAGTLLGAEADPGLFQAGAVQAGAVHSAAGQAAGTQVVAGTSGAVGPAAVARFLTLAPDAWRALVAAAFLAWIALLASRRSDARATHAALLLVCAAIAGLRASLEARRAPLVDMNGVGLVAGTFEASPSALELRGRVGGQLLLLPGAIVGADEVVVLDPVHPAPALPRGPEPGPRARAGLRPPVEIAPDEIARVGRAPRDALDPLLDALREARTGLAARARDVREPETRGLLLALLFGDSSELPPHLPDLFVRTGTFHLLAVSGLQVVLVMLILIGPFSRLAARLVSALTLGRVRAGPAWFALPLVILFVPIAGAGAPIVRSALGAAFALVAPGLPGSRPAVVTAAGRSAAVRIARRADSLSFWSFALILECVLSPGAPLSLSVQLSYSATLGLIVWTGPWLDRLRAGLGAPAPVSPVTRTGRVRSGASLVVRHAARRLRAGLTSAVAASIAAVCATLPFVWWRLAEWSPWGILATPALAPSMTALLALGWLRVLLGPLLVPDALLDPCAQAMIASMRAFDVLAFTPAPLPPRPFWLVALACAATLHLVHRLRTRERAHAPARVAALAWIALLVPWRAASAGVGIHALDVGAGTAVVIEGPGLGTWVFDAGSRDRPDVAREALGPLLRKLDPGPVGIVLSHADRDHDAAMPWLVERYPPRVFAGALPAHLAERLPHGAARIDVASGRVRLPALAGSVEGVELVLERGLEAEGNEGSRSLRVRVRDEQALLCGDAEEDGLRAWIRSSPGGPVRLVLWPHHGSEMELIEPFVRAIRPAEVWISASGEPPVHAELTRRAIVTRCTARDGPLHLRLQGGTVPAPATGSPPHERPAVR